jgi:hypothetical protein
LAEQQVRSVRQFHRRTVKDATSCRDQKSTVFEKVTKHRETIAEGNVFERKQSEGGSSGVPASTIAPRSQMRQFLLGSFDPSVGPPLERHPSAERRIGEDELDHLLVGRPYKRPANLDI